MNLSNLGKRLKREAAANPKKAAILGIVVLVALYFWAPLTWKWLRKAFSSDTTDVATDSAPIGAIAGTPPAASSATEATVKPAAAIASPGVNQPSWEQIAAWMEKDPRTKVGPLLQNVRNPFAASPDEMKDEQAEEAVVAKARAAAITPDAAGLTLTGTVIGPNRRVVFINGKSYKEGETVVVDKPAFGGPIAFTVIDVQPYKVVLQLGDNRYELTTPKPSSDKIEIIPLEQK